MTETQTEKQKRANNITVARLRYTMFCAKRHSRFLETAGWQNPKDDWIEPSQPDQEAE